MNINFEKLPAIIFDWVEKFAFADLNDSQKKEVLTYFSEEEFDQMHQVSLDLKSVSDIKDQRLHSQKKSMLLHHFDKHHAGLEKNSLFSRNVVMWQAAALLLLLLSGWLFYQIFDLQKNSTIRQIAVTDTVYVDREVSSLPEIIHDTVYRYKEASNSSQKETNSYDETVEPENFETIGEMEVQPMLEFESLGNSPKGNSMKDDSLLRKFNFVSM